MTDDASNSNRSIANPAKRQELLAILRELASPSLQEDLWINRNDAPNASGIDQVVHFFFDDTDLASDTNSEIGNIIINKGEAEAIKSVTGELDSIIKRIGDVDSVAFMADKDWNLVVAKSRFALDIMR